MEQFLHQLGGEVDVAFLACHTPGQQLATGEVISQAIVRSGTVIAQCQSTMCTNQGFIQMGGGGGGGLGSPPPPPQNLET